jgi:methionine-rich copper-binding protein CopC
MAVALTALAVALFFVPARVQAQDGLLRAADPLPGASLQREPGQLVLRFGRRVGADPRNTVLVTSPSGRDVTLGRPAVSGRGVLLRLRPPGEPGVYRVSYAVAFVDGQVSIGDYRFVVAAPGG